MKGILFPGNSKIIFTTFPDPKPKPDEVIVKMQASGVCGTDVHYWRNRGAATQIIPGHEASGIVVEVGSAVMNFKVGDRVIANSHVGCGHCTYCLRSEQVFCAEKGVFGRLRHGSDAEYVAVPERAALPLPERFSFEDGALLACNVTTAYSALLKLNDLSRQDYILVSGCGPVGLSAVMLASTMGAHVMASDLSGPRLELAKKLGAERLVNPAKENLPAAAKDWTHGRGVNGVGEFSGASAAYTPALEALAPHGALVVVGVGGEITISQGPLIVGELRIVGSAVFNQWQYEPLIAFLTENNLSLKPLVHTRLPIEQAEEALQMAASRDYAKILFSW
jgi:threonine dehydrogenase-like Zn-dependent dehydrogenase